MTGPRTDRPRSPRRRLRLAGLRLRRRLRPLGRSPVVVRLLALGTVRLGLLGAVALAVAVAGLFVTAVAVSAIYDEYGSHPERNAQTWAALKPKYASAGTCGQCHAPEALRWATEDHAKVPCQSCHGPMAGHELAGAVTDYEITDPASEALCAACHEKVQGRPAAIAQVELLSHFEPGTCVECHDPHSAIPLAPPRIPHPLDQLPDCKVCHGPGGLRAVPATHPIYPNEQCRGCHVQLTAGS